jgi:hypothetical protein
MSSHFYSLTSNLRMLVYASSILKIGIGDALIRFVIYIEIVLFCNKTFYSQSTSLLYLRVLKSMDKFSPTTCMH